jgi:hypothetical protein
VNTVKSKKTNANKIFWHSIDSLGEGNLSGSVLWCAGIDVGHVIKQISPSLYDNHKFPHTVE